MQRRSNIISNIVFMICSVIVLISTISVLFPALIVISISPHHDQNVMQINPFTIGFWTIPFFIVNSILLILGIIYFKQKLPHIATKSITAILDFEVSKKIAFVIMLFLLSFYVITTVGELDDPDEWEDSQINNNVESWSFDGGVGVTINFKDFVHYLSLNIFDNIRVLAFFTSIMLLILTYFFTVKISQKRFSGLLAVAIILQSTLFLTYDTTATYDNIWTLLYLFSLYVILYSRGYLLSPISYVFSMFSKMLTLTFLPLTLFFIYRSGVPNKNRNKVLISYGILVVLFLVLYSAELPAATNFVMIDQEFDSLHFWRGFTAFSSHLRYDGMVLMLLIPLMVGLHLAARRGMLQADSIMVIIAGMLLIAPILPALSSVLTVQPYRFIPLVVFFAIGIGILFSNRLHNGTKDCP